MNNFMELLESADSDATVFLLHSLGTQVYQMLLEFTPSECLEITAAVAHGVAPLVSRTPSEELYAEVIDTAAQCGLPVIESIRRRHAAAVNRGFTQGTASGYSESRRC